MADNKVQIIYGSDYPKELGDMTCYIAMDRRSYAGEVYRIIANPAKLSFDEIYEAAFASNCFGYRVEGDRLVVYTD